MRSDICKEYLRDGLMAHVRVKITCVRHVHASSLEAQENRFLWS